MHLHNQPRDKSRQLDAKRTSQTRRAERRDKSARLFITFAFMADEFAATRH